MNSVKKVVLGLGIASGAFIAAYLLTGEQGQRTKNYIVRRVRIPKGTINRDVRKKFDDSEIHYV